MRVDFFSFDLPEDLIALRPAVPRDNARLLHVPKDSPVEDLKVNNLPDLLKSGDALVLNDTKVIPARLQGQRFRGENVANISVTLHQRKDLTRWHAFVRPVKRLKEQEQIIFSANGVNLTATVEQKLADGEVVLNFASEGDLWEAFSKVGHMPLPPYIAAKRGEDKQDDADYQTVYAKERGAVAAPTAGLHFTDELLNELKNRGVSIHFVTLHVGAGTFLPVKVEDTDQHKMHTEWGSIDAETVAALHEVKAKGGRIVSVGTTSLRLLESASQTGSLQPWEGNTDIFIVPGYRFKTVDLLMTNFHLPKSTLFMLVSAFCGLDKMQQVYKYAIDHRYRFYSYGDSSLLERNDDQ